MVVVVACSDGGGNGTGEGGTSGGEAGSGATTTGSSTAPTSTGGEPSTGGPGTTGEPSPTSSEGSSEGGTTGGASCEVYVALEGQDVDGCGSQAAPCRTVTRGLSLATAGCAVRVGPGTFDEAGGEVLPLTVQGGVELIGAGDDPDAAPTILGDAVGSSSLEPRMYDCPVGQPSLLKAPLVLAGEGAALRDVIVVAPQVNDEVAVVVESGTVTIAQVRVEGGQEGIFVAGLTTVATMTRLTVTKAGHAAVKPAGTATVLIEDSKFFGNKDAVEPICDAQTTVRGSEVYCNGNGLEALADADTTLIDNFVHHNNVGIGGRGNFTMFLRGNVVEHNLIGALIWLGSGDLGTAADPGGNTLRDNVFSNLMTIRTPNDTVAIGNTWQPEVDGADAQGTYQGDVQFDPPQCPVQGVMNLDVPPPPDCTGIEPVLPDSGLRNVAIDDGSCFSMMPGPAGGVIVSEP